MLPTLDQAITLHRAGRLAEAETAYRAILNAEPDAALALRGLGLVLVQTGRAEDAIAVMLPLAHSADAELHNTLGVAFMQTGAWPDARRQFESALDQAPGHAIALANLGAVRYRMGDIEESVDLLSRAAKADPKNPEALFNLSLSLRALGELEAAEAAARAALDLAPKSAHAHVALGVAQAAGGDRHGAEAAYRSAIAADPRAAEGHHNLAQLLLAREALADGWQEFEWRWQTGDFAGADRFLGAPPWNGTPLAEGTLLVWTEQGIGDQILYASMLPDLEGQAPRILVACSARLVPLFARSFPFADVVSQADLLADEDALAAVTAQVPVGSLGRFLRPDVSRFPSRARHLFADAPRASELRRRYRDARGPKPLIGLSWRSTNPRFGAAKSIAMDELAAALSRKDAAFVSLQYGDIETDLADAGAGGLDVFRDPAVDPLADLDAFAAQVAALDLVVTVSNTTAHIAGALGVPCWIMVPAGHGRFWYWFLDRDNSPWYPSVRLFRQTHAGSWTEALDAIGAALTDWTPERPD